MKFKLFSTKFAIVSLQKFQIWLDIYQKWKFLENDICDWLLPILLKIMVINWSLVFIFIVCFNDFGKIVYNYSGYVDIVNYMYIVTWLIMLILRRCLHTSLPFFSGWIQVFHLSNKTIEGMSPPPKCHCNPHTLS